VWTAAFPDHKYMLGAWAGKRGQESAHLFMESVWAKLDASVVPTVVTDGYNVYGKEVLGRFSEEAFPDYCGRGRPPLPRKIPAKGLRYGTVTKTRDGKRLESVSCESVIGTVPPAMLNTSCIERMNLTARNSMARLKRKCITFSKSEPMLQGALDSFRSYYNLCRAHGTLRKERGGAATPAMSLGISDRIWTFSELMSFPYRQYTHYKL
jgi:IS1 family transposase